MTLTEFKITLSDGTFCNLNKQVFLCRTSDMNNKENKNKGQAN